MDFWLSRILPLFLMGINLFLGFYVWGRAKENSMRIMGVLSAFVFLYELAGHLLGYNGIPNLGLYNFANLIWVAGLLWYYHVLFAGLVLKRLSKYILSFYVAINLILTLIYTFHSNGLNTPGIIAGSSGVIFFALCYLNEENASDTTVSIFKNPHYFFTVGLIFIHLMFIFVHGMYNFLLDNYKSDGMRLFLIYLPVSGSVLFNLFISIGFICYLRNTKYTRPLQAGSW